MGQATPIADAAGRSAKGLALRINQPRGKRKCKPDRFCDGFNALIGMGLRKRGGDAIMAAVDGTGGSVEGVGFVLDASAEICIFNFCPNCGFRFVFPANK